MNGIVYPYGSSHLIQTKQSVRHLANLQQTHNVPEYDEIPASTLIQLSGGIDSTFVLWKWLKENPDKYCIVHHIELINYEKRHLLELEAVDKILKWLDSNGLNNYFYIQNTFDYGNFPDLISDVEICGFLSAVLLRTVRWEETDTLTMSIYNQHSEREIRRREIVNSTSKKKIKFDYVLEGMSKVDVIKQLPKELLELCWWCRVPINEQKCGSCFTCRTVEQSIESIQENKLKDFLKGM